MRPGTVRLGEIRTNGLAAVGDLDHGVASRLRAQRSGVDPRLDQFSEQRLRARSGVASGARLPAPRNQIVVRQVLMQERKVAAAIAISGLKLRAVSA